MPVRLTRSWFFGFYTLHTAILGLIFSPCKADLGLFSLRGRKDLKKSTKERPRKVAIISSEIQNPEFHQRLLLLIGHERPFAWAKGMGISKGAFTRIYRFGTTPRPSTIDKIVRRTGCSRDWLVHGRVEPDLPLRRATRAPLRVTYDRVDQAVDEFIATSMIGPVVEAIEEGLGDKHRLSPRQKVRLISVATSVYLAMKPETRQGNFGLLARALVELFLHHRDKFND